MGLPGRGIDHGQNARESLIREIAEEVGISIPFDSIGEDPLFISVGGAIGNIPRITLFYRVKANQPFEPYNNELSFVWADIKTLARTRLGPNIEIVREKIESCL